MESFHLHIGLENFLEDPLNGHQDQGRDEEDVGEVEGEPPQCIVGAVGLHIPGMMSWVCATVRASSTLTWLRYSRNIMLISGSHNHLPECKECRTRESR